MSGIKGMQGKKCEAGCECGRHSSRTVEVCERIGESNIGKHSGYNTSYPCDRDCQCKRHQGRPSLQAMTASLQFRQENGQSLETRQKIRESTLRYLESHSGFFKDTGPELAFERLLQNRGSQYEKQRRIGSMLVDFYLSQQNLVVEIDGCWWHGCKACCPTTPHEDRFLKRQENLMSLGYEAIRIWEHELKSGEVRL